LFDNAGKFSEYVHEDTIKSVCEAFPRNGWSEAFACAVEKEMRLVHTYLSLNIIRLVSDTYSNKPWSHTTTFEKPNWRQEGKGSQFGDTARGNDVMRPYD
jgi:cyanamide hydratase